MKFQWGLIFVPPLINRDLEGPLLSNFVEPGWIPFSKLEIVRLCVELFFVDKDRVGCIKSEKLAGIDFFFVGRVCRGRGRGESFSNCVLDESFLSLKSTSISAFLERRGLRYGGHWLAWIDLTLGVFMRILLRACETMEMAVHGKIHVNVKKVGFGGGG